MHSKICATLCLLSAVLAAPAAARTPTQLRADVSAAVSSYTMADSLASRNKAAARKRAAALQPLRGARPAEVAAAGKAYVVRWVTVKHERCYALGVTGRGYSSPFGGCLPATVPCASLCFYSFGLPRLNDTGFTYYAGGTVPAAATSVEITLLGGQHVTVKPSSQVVDGRRGVLAVLVKGDLRSAVARAGSRVVGRMARTAADVRHECSLLRLRCAP